MTPDAHRPGEGTPDRQVIATTTQHDTAQDTRTLPHPVEGLKLRLIARLHRRMVRLERRAANHERRIARLEAVVGIEADR